MHAVTTFEELILALAIVACCYYVFARKRRQHWPVTNALIQKGAIGELKGDTHNIPTAFMGYTFKVNGLRYAGCFVLFGNNEARVHELYRLLPGSTLQVRYDPSNPNTSFLANYSDAHFLGLVASQSPVRLAQAPASDLRDAIEG